MLNTALLHDVTHYLEIHDYLKEYEKYKQMDYEEMATCCIKIYHAFIEESIKQDLYLVPDFFKEHKNIINKILNEF